MNAIRKTNRVIYFAFIYFLALGFVSQLHSIETVEKTIQLKYIDPEVAKIHIQPLLSRSGKVTINKNTRQLTIIDYPVKIAVIEKTLHSIDKSTSTKVPETNSNSSPYPKIIKIKSMPARNMHDLLKESFPGQLNNEGRYARRSRAAKEKVYLGNVKIQVLPAKNSLMVIANSEDHRKIKQVINLIESAQEDSADEKSSKKGGVTTEVVTFHNLSSSEGKRILDHLVHPAKRSNRNDPAKGAILKGIKIDIIENKENNALILTGDGRSIRKTKKLIAIIDRTPSQVLIEIMILEVTLKNGQSIGFEWGLNKKNATIQNKYDLKSQMNSGMPGFFSIYSNDYMEAVFKAIEDTANVKVLSAPHVLVANNKKAKISIGDSVVVNKESLEIPTGDVSNPIVRTTHEYIDVGLKLEIQPKINENGLISIFLRQDVNDIKDSGIAGFPEISKRNLTSTIISRDRESVILGGLINRKTSVSESKVPIIGYLPILGRLFRKTTREEKTTELVLFLTPYIIHSEQDIRRVTDYQKKKMKEINKQFMKKAERK